MQRDVPAPERPPRGLAPAGQPGNWHLEGEAFCMYTFKVRLVALRRWNSPSSGAEADRNCVHGCAGGAMPPGLQARLVAMPPCTCRGACDKKGPEAILLQWPGLQRGEGGTASFHAGFWPAVGGSPCQCQRLAPP